MSKFVNLLFATMTAVVTVLGYFFLDFSELIKRAMLFANISGTKDDFIWISDIYIKISVLGIVALGLFSYFLLTRSKTYDVSGLAGAIASRRKRICQLDLVGYSIGFVEPTRLQLEMKPNRDLSINLVCMDDEFISNFLTEEKSVESRIITLNERIGDWRRMEERGYIKSFKVTRISQFIPYYAAVVDKSEIFFASYTWHPVQEKFNLKKIPISDRGMIKLLPKDAMYNVVNNLIYWMPL